ncbi:hypothetical protein K474DRAFT_1681759 [Panus rudis PR-1116 ss-1]|nr:hypothetical protein K474DRAFT_1681759 [Panus rudis PR-1116 ss-1]
MSSVEEPNESSDKPNAIRLTIPERYYLLPGAAVVVGTTIGLFRGSRRASLRFLAENVHRPPTTVQGWYFYNKTKNYRVLMGGLKEGAADAARLGATAMGWVVIEEGCKRLGCEEIGEVAAGLGTAGVFSLAYRLPWKATSRTLLLGLMIGAAVQGLRWSREQLREQAQARLAEVEAAAAEGRAEVVEAVEEAVESRK